MTNEEAKAKAKALLADMSVDEKVAQIGGILYMNGMWDRIKPMLSNGMGEISCLCVREMKSLEEIEKWQHEVQTEIMERSPHHIPAIFHIEGLCGSFTQGSTSIPSGVSRGSSFDVELEEKLGEMVAKQELACGFTHILAPVLDVARDPRMGRCGESYGEDPALVSAMGTAFAKGLQKAEVNGLKADAVAKHFFGFHTSSGGIHGVNADICERDHLETFGRPFAAAIKNAGMKGVMPCYCAINGEPVHLSEHFLDEILRVEMGFDGLVFSDYGGLSNAYEYDHVGDSYEEVGLMGLKAGMDQELPFPRCYNGNGFADIFKNGEADMELLDRAVLRVLTAKYRMGLFENPYGLSAKSIQEIYDAPENYELTLQSARESLVLLKNEDVLPIKKDVKKVAVVGCHANNARFFFGGYTHLDMATAQLCAKNSMAGVGQNADKAKPEDLRLEGSQVQNDEQEEFDAVLKHQKPDCKNLLEELRDRLGDVDVQYAFGYPKYGTDTSHFEEALKVCEGADLIIMTLGGKWGSGSICTMGEGIDTMYIGVPECQEKFIAEASKLHIPMVGLAFEGRPVSSDIADEKLSAILECWAPSEAGAQAIVDVLTGKVNPSGKMPVCTALNAGQIPVYHYQVFGSGTTQAGSIGFNDYVDGPGTHAPRYYFGAGLSYTTFEYSNLSIDKKEIQPDETITVKVDITNTGSVKGCEIPFLFLTDERASMVRPSIQNYGFARVELEAGEIKTVQFELNPSQTAFLTNRRQLEWKIEKGEFTVKVGRAANDIRLTDSFIVTRDAYIKGVDREFYCLGKVL